MARLIPGKTVAHDGRFALVDDADGSIIGFGHLEINFVPPTSDGAILNGLQFVLEPRTEDRSNEQMLKEANASVI